MVQSMGSQRVRHDWATELTEFTLIHGPNIPDSYAILFFTASDFASITSHIHNWVLFLLWLSLFILSWAISLLFSSSILDTYRPGEFIFQCHISLPFHTVHGVLRARILKWFASPFSSGPHFVRILHHDPSILDGPTGHGSEFHWVRQGYVQCDPFDYFLWLWFSFYLPPEG